MQVETVSSEKLSDLYKVSQKLTGRLTLHLPGGKTDQIVGKEEKDSLTVTSYYEQTANTVDFVRSSIILDQSSPIIDEIAKVDPPEGKTEYDFDFELEGSPPSTLAGKVIFICSPLGKVWFVGPEMKAKEGLPLALPEHAGSV